MRTRTPLLEADAYQRSGLFLVPPVGGATCAVHVPEELSAHCTVVRTFTRQGHESWLIALVDLGVEVRPLYINEAQLGAVRMPRVPDRRVVTNLGQANDKTVRRTSSGGAGAK